MSINIYWTCMEREWQRAKEPQLVAKSLYAKNLHSEKSGHTAFHKCPAVRDNLTNLYELRSIYDYRFWITDNDIRTDMHDAAFAEEHVLVRDIDVKLFSFMQRFIFFTDQPSLEMTLYEFPVFENNNITKNCRLLPGKFDIGKWYRNIEFPFFLNGDKFEIEMDEVYSYMRFHTNEKINFIQYRNTEKLEEYRKDDFYMSGYTRFKRLDKHYANFKLKKQILKEIKENIL